MGHLEMPSKNSLDIKKLYQNVKYFKIVSVWFRSHANVAQACSIVLSAHQVMLPPGSARSDPQASPGEGLTPHTIHHYSFGPLQAPLPLPSKG